jgi:translation elongation factor EF-Tu-like GTPase
MSVQASDIKFKKSVVVTDTSANGGRKGQTEVVSGARHNLFPRVSKAERTAGVTRYRKEFWCNENADDDVAFDLMVFAEFPSNGGDRFAIGKGSQTNTQGDIATTPPDWLGVGKLETALLGSE